MYYPILKRLQTGFFAHLKGEGRRGRGAVTIDGQML